MAGRANPVLDVINSYSRPIEGMSRAANTYTQAGQSFEKGASLMLKLDKLLGEEEARLQNNVFKAQEMMQNSVKMAMDANYRDASLGLEAAKLNSLNEQRDFANKFSVAQAADTNYWKGKELGIKEAELDNDTFQKELKLVNLNLKKKTVYDPDTNTYKKEYTPESKKLLDSFNSKWGKKFGLYEANNSSVTAPTEIPVPAAWLDQPQPQVQMNAPQQTVAASEQPQANVGVAPVPQPAQNMTIQEASTIVGKALQDGVKLPDDIKASVIDAYEKAGMPDTGAKIIEAYDANFMGPEYGPPAPRKMAPTEQIKMGIKTVQNEDGSLIPVKTSGETIDPVTGKAVPSKIVYYVNGKPKTTYTNILLDANGKITRNIDNVISKIVNPEVIVAQSNDDNMFDTLKTYYDEVPDTAKKLYAKKAFSAIAKLRPDALTKPGVANDISIMFGDGLNNQVINEIRTTIASYNGQKGKKLANRVAAVLTNMVKYRGFNNDLPDSTEKVLDGAIETAALYSFNPLIAGNIFYDLSLSATDREIKPDEIKFDKEMLKASWADQIKNEFKTHGYSKTLQYIKSFKEITDDSGTYDMNLFWGNNRYSFNPATAIKDDLEKQGINKKVVNKVLHKIFGTTNTKYYSRDSLERNRERAKKDMVSYAKVYGGAVDDLAEQLALNRTYGSRSNMMTFDIGDEKVKLSIDTVKKLLAYRFAATIEKDI